MKNFFLILTAFFLSCDLFVWWRGARLLKRCKARIGPRIFFHLFLAFQTALLATILISRSQGISLDAYIPSAAVVAVFIWHPIILPLLVLLHFLGLLKEAVMGILRWFSPPSSRQREEKPPQSPPASPPRSEQEALAEAEVEEAKGQLQLTRRRFLGTAAALTPPLATLVLTAIAERQLSEFRIRRITIDLPQLPEALDGMTIAHLTDIHVGRFTHGRVLKKIADATNALNPDFVIFTGDLINDSLEWMPQAIEMIEAINKPVYLCEGNHDRIDNKKHFWEAMRSTPNVVFLMQQEKTVTFRGEKVQFLGSAWDRTNDPALTIELEKLRDPQALSIFLVHHPHSWDHPHQFALTFAGHTHGGQLMATKNVGFGPKMYRYWTGLYERATGKGKQALVVSNGVGNWFPLRVNAPAEIVLITLRRA